MPVTLILSVGSDPNLLVSRSLVLQFGGYQVVTAYSIKEAAGRIQEGDFDLVLLCQSISTSDMDWLIAWIRASGSRIPIVLVSQQLYRVDAYAGAIVTIVSSEPAALLLGIQEILMKTAPPLRRTTITAEKRQATDMPPKGPPIRNSPESVSMLAAQQE